jgi:hypothetical protein
MRTVLMGPEFYSIGVVTRPTKSKVQLGSIAFEEARKRDVDTVYHFAFATKSKVRADEAFGGAQLE